MREIELDLTQPDIHLDIIEDTHAKGLYIGRDNDSLTSKITITHSKPHLQSRITIKSVVFDNAKVDLEGMLVINKGATETDTYLKLDCLVIGDKASARAVPSLEIYEDNVAGGHGATIGYVDPEMISYLQSKGINAQSAEDLLVEAFIGGD